MDSKKNLEGINKLEVLTNSKKSSWKALKMYSEDWELPVE